MDPNDRNDYGACITVAQGTLENGRQPGRTV